MDDRKVSRNEKLSKFKKGARKRVSLDQSRLVKQQLASPDHLLPLVLTPNDVTLDLPDWAASNRAKVDELLHKHGALLFRGFDMGNVEGFGRFVKETIREIYRENTEHRLVTEDGSVQIPVEYAASMQLLWHNENTFNPYWPGRIIFACAVPAAEGGETPLVDAREMYRRIDPKVRAKFEEKGVMYVRNYRNILGLSWQQIFKTEDPAVAEATCRAGGFEFQWYDQDHLKTRAIRHAAVKHPVTGDPCWANQAQHFHFSCLDPTTRASLAEMFSEDEYPRNCFFGDGSKIEDSIMDDILALYRELEVVSPWQQGDVVMVDNLLAAHGRNPYKGERKILVCMGDMIDAKTLTPTA